MKNYLSWWNADLTHFSGKALCLFAKLSEQKDLDISEEDLAIDDFGNRNLVEKLLILTRIADNAFLLFNGDEGKVITWLFASNKRFCNYSPYQMVMMGDGEAVYTHQEKLLNCEKG